MQSRFEHTVKSIKRDLKVRSFRYPVIHRDVAISVSRLEEEQNIGFFATVPKMTLPARHSDQPSNIA
jgi:hypothetical protein